MAPSSTLNPEAPIFIPTHLDPTTTPELTTNVFLNNFSPLRRHDQPRAWHTLCPCPSAPPLPIQPYRCLSRLARISLLLRRGGKQPCSLASPPLHLRFQAHSRHS